MSSSENSVDVGISVGTAELDSGMQHAVDSVEHGAHEMESAFEGIKDVLGELAAAIGVTFTIDKIVEFGKAAFETAEQVENMSVAFGYSTQTIQTMGYAAALVGGSLDGAQQAMSRLARSAEQAVAGNQQMAEGFHAIGISSQQLAVLIKTPDDLIKAVSQHMSEYGGSLAKTADAQQLFGRGAATIIPMLQELGANFDELKKTATDLGLVLSDTDQHALAEAQKGLNDLGQQVKGLGNTFALTLLPVVNEARQALADWLKSGDAKAAMQSLADGLKFLADNFSAIKAVVVTLVEIKIASWAIQATASLYEMAAAAAAGKTSIMSIGGAVGVVGSAIAGWQFGTYLRNNFVEAQIAGNLFVEAIEVGWETIKYGAQVMWLEIKKAADSAFTSMESDISSLTGALSKIAAYSGQLDIAADLQAVSVQFSGAATSAKSYDDQINTLTVAHTKAVAGIKAITDEMSWEAIDASESAKATTELGHAMTEAGGKALDFNGKVKDTSGALKSFQEDTKKLDDLMQQISSGLSGPYLQALDQYQKGEDLINKTWADAVTAGTATHELLMQLQNDQTLLEKRLAATDDRIKEQHDQFAKLNDELTLQQTLLHTAPQDQAAVTAALKAYNEALKANVDLHGDAIPLGREIHDVLNEQLPAWIAEKQAVDNASAAVKAQNQVWKDWQGIASNGLDSVGNSIASFATGGIKSWKDFGNSLLADTKQFIAAIIEEFLKLTVFNGIINSIFNLSGSSALPTLASIGGAAAGGGGSGLLGSALSLAQVGGGFGGTGGSSILGALGIGGAGSSQSLMGSLFGTGGFDSGIGNMLSSGGGLGGALGTLGGAFAGFELGKQLTGSTAGGIAGGVGLGALSYFVPVVGWIAGAAALINQVTGGGLFGTSYKPTGNTSTDVTIGAGGANTTNFTEESKKKALFGGRSWKEVSSPATADQQTATDQIFAGLTKSIQSGATALGVAIPPIIGGAFATTFDKTGKLTSQLSTVLGQTYSETIQQFAERVTADNLLALLPAAQNASAIAAQWQKSADDLMAGTEVLVQAQIDINHGMGLLGSDSSLADVITTVQSLQAQGETLAQTYVRLQDETQSMQADLSAVGLQTNLTGSDFVKFSDQLTQMAGGVQNLNALWQSYYSNYFSASEQAANTLKGLQGNVTSTFGAIGEDSSESMADFRAHFTAAFPNLTAEQVAQWLAAGDALAKLNAYLAQTDDQATQTVVDLTAQKQAYSDFIDGFNPAQANLTDFEKTLTGLDSTLEGNIAQANTLAKAAGMAGASTEDLGKIIAASAVQGAAAVREFEAATQQLATTLYGVNTNALQAQLTAFKKQAASVDMNQFGAYQLVDYYNKQADQVQAQIDAQAAAAQAAQRLQEAGQLLGNLGQIGAITGGSLKDFAAQFSIPLDKFASDLGLTQDQLDAAYQQQVDTAAAALNTADYTRQSKEYLADVVAILSGQPLPVDVNSIRSGTGDDRAPNIGIRHRGGSGTVNLPTGNDGGIIVHLSPEHVALIHRTNDLLSEGNTQNRMTADNTTRLVNAPPAPPGSIRLPRGRMPA